MGGVIDGNSEEQGRDGWCGSTEDEKMKKQALVRK